MVTTEDTGPDATGKIPNCSPLSYKIPNVRSIPRKFNVTLMKNHNYVTTAYSSKVILTQSSIFSTVVFIM